MQLRVCLVAVAALTLGACGDDSSSDPEDLDGRTFAATMIDGHDIVEGSEVILSFEDGSVSVRAGCNIQNVAYEVVDGELRAGELASTMMACEEALMTQDAVVAAIVSANPTIALTGDELTLSGGVATMTLIESD